MPANTNRSGEAQQINFQCPCGKRFSAPPQLAGKKVKCSACGQILVAPTNTPPVSITQTPQMENESAAMSRRTLIALWSFLGVFALAGVFFVVWYSRSSQQAEIAAANDRISQAVATANEWIGGNSLFDGETVEQTLIEALNNQVATEKGDGEVVLTQVRQRRKQLVERALIEQAQRQAKAIWDDAQRQIDGNRITEAIALLQTYVADPHAIQKSDAQRLLSEAKTALSDILALEALIAMTDEDFERVKTSGEIRDGKVTHPVLAAVRSETVQRNLEKAVQRREEIRLAAEKQRELELLAREHAERLRTRTPDVRKVCWGDSRQTVEQVEEITLKLEGKSLSGKVELYDREAILSYAFYDDALVKVAYWINFGEFGNPFELDGPLRSTLNDKYGEGKVKVGGLTTSGFDTTNGSFRETVWDLPRHTIRLSATVHGGSAGRHLFLVYTAKTAEARAYDEQGKRELEESLRKSEEARKKNL